MAKQKRQEPQWQCCLWLPASLVEDLDQYAPTESRKSKIEAAIRHYLRHVGWMQ